MPELKFTCPKCGDNRLERILLDAVVCTRVTAIENFDGWGVVEFDSDDEIHEYGNIRFQCVECGFVIDTGDDKEVVLWVEENCPQEEDDD